MLENVHTLRTLSVFAALALGCSSSASGDGTNTVVTPDAAATGEVPKRGADAGSPGTGSDAAVAASSDAAGAKSSDATIATSKPAAPTVLSLAEDKGKGKGITVKWSVTDSDLEAIDLYVKKDGGAYSKLLSTAGTVTSAFDANATPGSGMPTYYYKAKALRGGLESDFSNEKSLMTGM